MEEVVGGKRNEEASVKERRKTYTTTKIKEGGKREITGGKKELNCEGEGEKIHTEGKVKSKRENVWARVSRTKRQDRKESERLSKVGRREGVQRRG